MLFRLSRCQPGAKLLLITLKSMGSGTRSARNDCIRWSQAWMEPTEMLDAELERGTIGRSQGEVADDVAYKRLVLVNIAFIGRRGAGDREWVLVDAGLPGSADIIRRAAAARFGKSSRPAAIILTHGHFDHVGALETLAEDWDVPIYAHFLEHPYLAGAASYPPPDPLVGGGLMALSSPIFPRSPINVSSRLQALPEDGSLPSCPGWRWIHTPGHSVGHVSLWREADRLLIAGDAVITTRQESAMAVLLQRREIHGPPRYFTIDWQAAERSFSLLAGLMPEIILSGHGQPLRGEAMRRALAKVSGQFAVSETPSHGRYVARPATAHAGNAYRRP